MPYIILSLQLQLFFKQDSQKKYYIHFSDFTYFIYFLSSQSFNSSILSQSVHFPFQLENIIPNKNMKTSLIARRIENDKSYFFKKENIEPVVHTQVVIWIDVPTRVRKFCVAATKRQPLIG